jgi:hypothetical protein
LGSKRVHRITDKDPTNGHRHKARMVLQGLS